ncbi:hypothetical protein MKX03_019948 [Papaver bracteatum]|nr:hypothetical protein MKX03_019948 [Papaver bracteatum]
MARQLRSFFLFLFVSSIMFVSSIQRKCGLRQQSGSGSSHLSVVTDVIGGKKSGLSRGGVGHSYVNGIGGKKNSGPSPGKGH